LAVAASTPLFANLVSQTETIEDIERNLILVLITMVLTVLPSFFIELFTEKWKLSIISLNVGDAITKNFNNVELWSDKTKKEKITSMLTHDIFSMAEDSTYYIVDLISLVLNVSFTLIAMSIFIDANLLLPYLIGYLCTLILYRKTKKTIKTKSENAQNSRIDLNSTLRIMWDNVVLGNNIHFKKWKDKYTNSINNDQKNQYDRVYFSTCASNVSNAFFIIPVIMTIAYLYSSNSDDMLYIIALLSTIPRHLAMSSFAYSIISISYEMPKISAEISNFSKTISGDYNNECFSERISINKLKITNDQQLEINHYMFDDNIEGKSPSRITIRGDNGSGKSSLLQKIKSKNENSIYIPSNSDLIVSQENTSTGQRVKEVIVDALKSKENLILLDEWDANLDSITRHEISRMIDQHSKDKVIVEVKHNA
jgi:ABC-type transport system involved in cytochrome bd biosynthesis fused ATPase/permease subunit